MSTLDNETLKAAVRETYGQIASGKTTAGCCSGVGCCGPASGPTSDGIGYSGGRLAIADIVAVTDLPSSVRDDLAAYAGCVAGAALVSDVVGMLNDAGFRDVVVDVRSESRERGPVTEEAPASQNLIASALIRAKKPFTGQSRG